LLYGLILNSDYLNTTLTSTRQVGHEFSQVEGLWSQFENVMANQPEAPKEDTREGAQNERS
jgi:DASH complex subunit DAD1